MDKAKQEIQRLISFYEDLKKSGKYDSFNEDETCRKLILPLFAALGWDPEGRKISDEVTGQEIAGGQKRVDYSFNINSSPVLFLEAKQLSADLYRPEFAQQAINYGYNKSVKWVVLSDFEGTKVFNSSVKAKQLSEKTILDLKYTEYLNKFDELWLLSKESIVNGKLNEYAKTKGHVSNKVPINELLLAKLLKWRDRLERRISNDNPRLSKEETQECVQKLINRLIFIRTCEDRKIDKENILKYAVKEWESGSGKSLLKMLNDIFRDFDDGYNSNLFAEHEIEKLKIEDDVLAEIMNGLYEDAKEDVSFDFSVIDADMLGSIYEQYLGTIQRGGGSNAKRKSQGIYYTPKYIVDYIVENTLGKVLTALLKERKYKEIGKIKVLDPACGSGSFLLKALKVFDDAYSKSPEHNQFPFMRKIKALSNNIYGVDLDEEAVELTKLNLLLNVVSSRKKLPNLSHNIECGNSLIDDSRVAGDRAFNWESRFKDVMDKGGFDVVIGNPPYIRSRFINKEIRDYFIKSNKYKTLFRTYDIYCLFIEKSIELLNNQGRLSFILPYSFLIQEYSKKLRAFLLDHCCIEMVYDLSATRVFRDAMVLNCILVVKKEPKAEIRANNKVRIDRYVDGKTKQYSIGQRNFDFRVEKVYSLGGGQQSSILRKLNRDIRPLGDLCYISKGVEVYNRQKKDKKEDYIFEKALNGAYKPYIEGKNIDRYKIMFKNKYLHYQPQVHCSGKFPELFENPKLLVRNVSGKEGLIAAYDNKHYYVENTIVCCLLKNSLKDVSGFNYSPEEIELSSRYDLFYILGLLNSKLINKYFLTNLSDGLHVYVGPLSKIPIKAVDFQSDSERSLYKSIIKSVGSSLELNREYARIADKQTSETERLKEKIDEIDREIDQLVYKLYGLTKGEIEVVEGGKLE